MASGGPVTAANDAKLRDFAVRAVKAQPLGYLRAVLGRPGALGGVAAEGLPRRRHRVLLLLPPDAVSHPEHHSWVAGRHRLLRRGGVRARHPEPRGPAGRVPDRRVPAGVLHLRAAVRPDHAHRPGRGAAAAAPPEAPAASVLVAPDREHAALGDRGRAAWCSRSRSPTSTTATCSPSSRSPAWPRAWRSPRPGSRPRRNRSPSRGTTSPARCPDRSAEARLCQFVSV